MKGNICLLHQLVCTSIVRDGRSLTDSEVIGMLIGLLLAGQHTSSTTSAWLGFFLARDKSLQVTDATAYVLLDQCSLLMQNLAYEEQVKVCGEDLPHLDYDQVSMYGYHRVS